MDRLSETSFASAGDFLRTRARPLERALFEYEFGSGSYDSVMDELENFQNEDGGFGNALEPDLRCKESSALATTTALQILDSLDLEERGKGMVDRAVDYFIRTYQEELHGWDIIPIEAECSPRAVWWKYGAFRDHWGNPNAEIVGYLMKYPADMPDGRLDTLYQFAIDNLHRSDLKEMHELFCYLRLAEVLEEDKLALIKEQLDRFVDHCVADQPDDRAAYGITPLKIVDSPMARYYQKFAEVIPAELDQLISEQGTDGAWEPNWNWYQYEDEWQVAKQEWKGVMTLANLKTLKNFDRIAGIMIATETEALD